MAQPLLNNPSTPFGERVGDTPQIKNLPANAGDIRDRGSIPGSGMSSGRTRQLATHSSILTWRIPWTEESGRLESTGSQKVGHD